MYSVEIERYLTAGGALEVTLSCAVRCFQWCVSGIFYCCMPSVVLVGFCAVDCSRNVAFGVLKVCSGFFAVSVTFFFSSRRDLKRTLDNIILCHADGYLYIPQFYGTRGEREWSRLTVLAPITSMFSIAYPIRYFPFDSLIAVDGGQQGLPPTTLDGALLVID